jgi:hypothetical protein
MTPQVRDRLPPVEFLAVVVAVVVAVLVVVVFSLRGGGDDLSQGAPIRVRSLLTPRAVLFGDTLTAQLEVASDTHRVDPSSVRIDTRFGPYRAVAPPTVRRREIRGADYLSWTATLLCLELECVPAGEGQTRVRLGPARVTYALEEDGVSTARTIVVRWPPVLVHSRVDAAELAARDPRGEPPWRADLGSLPAVTYRASPTLVAAVLVGLGAVLVGSALALLSPVLLPLLRWRGDGDGSGLPPLEQALELLERDEGGVDSVQERREALELVAAELARRGEPELELSARGLAWSESPPPHEHTLALAQSVRRLNGSGRNGRAA